MRNEEKNQASAEGPDRKQGTRKEADFPKTWFKYLGFSSPHWGPGISNMNYQETHWEGFESDSSSNETA